jgi:hypothetical protein
VEWCCMDAVQWKIHASMRKTRQAAAHSLFSAFFRFLAVEIGSGHGTFQTSDDRNG